MNDLLVSIITVCFNSEKTIERTIQSVLNQTYENIEYLIIDGASTDGTLDIVKKYEADFNGRMTIVSEPDDGLYYAMNKGIKLAKGTIIGIINSDDYYELDAVEKVVNAYETNHENPMTIYYGADRAVRDGKEVSIGFVNADNLENSMISHPATFVTKATYDEMGAFDEDTYRYVADYDMLLRFKRSGKITFVPVYEVLANFSLGGLCSTGAAYMDLLKMQLYYGKITKSYYKRQLCLGKLYKIKQSIFKKDK